MRGFDRDLLRAEAEENEFLAGFDPWAAVADVVRGVLRDREERREREAELRAAADALSGDAWRVVRALHAAGGLAFAFDLPGPVRAVTELQDLGLVATAVAYDEQGEPAEPVVLLRMDVEIPGT